MNFEKFKNILIYAFLFLLPWQTRWILRSGELNGGYWEYGTISLYFTESLIWTAILLYPLSKIKVNNFRFQISDFRLKIKETSIFYSLLLIAYSLLLGLAALKPDLHFYYLFRVIEGIGLYVLIKSVDARKAAWAFVLGMIPQAFLGVYQFLTQSSFANKLLGMAAHDPSTLGTFVVETASGRWLRAYGGLPHPNIFGAYLVVAIMLLANLMFCIHNKKFQISDFKSHNFLLVTSYWLLVTFVAALFFTFSRSAWLAFFIFLVAYLIVTIRSRSRPYCNGIKIASGIVLVIILTFVTMGSIFSEPLFSRIKNSNRLENKSRVERLSGYREARQLFKKHPLIGIGLGNYTYAVHEEIDNSRPSYSYQPVHNIFALLATELGILGILAIFSLAIWWFLRIRSSTLIFTAVLVIVLGLFDHYLVSLYPGIMLLCSIFGLAYINKESDPHLSAIFLKRGRSEEGDSIS